MDVPREVDGPQWVRSAVSRFERPLLAYALRMVGDADAARDIVQDTFVRLCDRPPADVNGHLAEWLYTVCRNKALDARRKERRRKPMTATATDMLISETATPDEQAERRDTSDQALRLLGKLPEDQQEAIRLKFQHGMSYRQIAAITGHSESNVGFLIHTGLKSLRNRMTS